MLPLERRGNMTPTSSLNEATNRMMAIPRKSIPCVFGMEDQSVFMSLFVRAAAATPRAENVQAAFVSAIFIWSERFEETYFMKSIRER